MSITIKAIDILKSNNEFVVREIHDSAKFGQTHTTHATLHNEYQALTSAKRRAALLKVKFLGMMEAVK